MVTLPSRQKGALDWNSLTSGATELRNSIGRLALKNKYIARFHALEKSEKDLWAHRTLAGSGLSMAFMSVAAVAGSDLSAADIQTYAENVLNLKSHFSGVNSPAALAGASGDLLKQSVEFLPEPIKKVSGTFLTGMLNFVRNWKQIEYLKSAEGETIDTSTFEGRQERRLKQAKSNIVSALTNVPQLAEGVLLGDWKRIAAAGTAVVSYTTRSGHYKYVHNKRAKGEEVNSGYFTRKMPGDIMLPRGVAQASVASEILPEFGPVAGLFSLLAGAGQTSGAAMMISSDQEWSKAKGDNAPDVRLP